MIFFTPIKLPLQPTDMSLFENSIFPTIKRKITSCRNPEEVSTIEENTQENTESPSDDMETRKPSALRDVYGSKWLCMSHTVWVILYDSYSMSQMFFKMPFQDWRLYMMGTGFVFFVLRRTTYQSWLGAGWPQYVVANNPDIDGDDFDLEINTFQSTAYFCLIVANIVPGSLIDYLAKTYPRLFKFISFA